MVGKDGRSLSGVGLWGSLGKGGKSLGGVGLMG